MNLKAVCPTGIKKSHARTFMQTNRGHSVAHTNMHVSLAFEQALGHMSMHVSHMHARTHEHASIPDHIIFSRYINNIN